MTFRERFIAEGVIRPANNDASTPRACCPVLRLDDAARFRAVQRIAAHRKGKMATEVDTDIVDLLEARRRKGTSVR